MESTAIKQASQAYPATQAICTDESLAICIEHLAGHMEKMSMGDRMEAFRMLQNVVENPGQHSRASAAIVAMIGAPLSPIRKTQRISVGNVVHLFGGSGFQSLAPTLQ